MPAESLDDENGNCKRCGHPFNPHIITAYDTSDFSKGGEMRCPVENCQCFSTISFDLKVNSAGLPSAGSARLGSSENLNTVIEMHDSECIAIGLDEMGGCFVLLDAYVHRGDGDPLKGPHEGGVQRIRIKAERMTMEGIAGDLPALIYEGSLSVGADVQGNIVRFPASYMEPFRLSMMLADDARVVVASGKGLSIEAESEFRFVEAVDFSSREG